MTTSALLRFPRAIHRPPEPSSDFDLNQGTALPPNRNLRSAAVLIGMKPSEDGFDVLLTRRSAKLRHHPGQISFPGGKQDKTDLDPVSTALREATEEVALKQTQVSVLGCFPPHETVTQFQVTPVLGLIEGDFQPEVDTREVAEAFWVPWSHFADPKRFVVQSRRWAGQDRKYYAIPFGPYYIWGATARMLYALSRAAAE